MSNEPREILRVAFVKFAENARRAYMYQSRYCIEDGTRVLCESNADDGTEVQGIVVDSDAFNLDYASDKREMRRLLAVSGNTLPLKRITGVIKEDVLGDDGLAWTMDVFKKEKEDDE